MIAVGHRLSLAVALAGVLSGECLAQAPVIHSIQLNGRMAWSNAPVEGTVYRVEWASNPGGPWHSFTHQPLHSLDANGKTNFVVEIPMVYRVVMTTSVQPPQGMVWIDGGDVALGQDGIATPVHTNFVGSFWMDEMEVTKARWDEVAGWAATNGFDITPAGGAGKAANHPVQMVSWYECAKWCNARSRRDGLVPCYYTSAAKTSVYTNGTLDLQTNWVNWAANGYRLPTEAEWEKGARGARQGRLFPWGGDSIQHARANYKSDPSYSYDTSPTPSWHPTYDDGIVPFTSPAGSFPANPYGLHDMAGNIWEWVWDWHAAYSAAYQTDPRGPATGTARVLRGGAWFTEADRARCADRYPSSTPSTAADYLGFRCVRGP